MGKVIGYRACHAITCEVMVVINKIFTVAKYIITYTKEMKILDLLKGHDAYA